METKECQIINAICKHYNSTPEKLISKFGKRKDASKHILRYSLSIKYPGTLKSIAMRIVNHGGHKLDEKTIRNSIDIVANNQELLNIARELMSKC